MKNNINKRGEKKNSFPESCFIITPIGNQDSETFKETTGLIDAVIEPVLSKFNFSPLPAHHIVSTGSITAQILDCVTNCRLVIANLTGLNSNVMFEVGVRHTIRRPLILLAKEGTVLPFDIRDHRTIFYSDAFSGVNTLKKRLEEMIKVVLDEDFSMESPIDKFINQFKQNQQHSTKSVNLEKQMEQLIEFLRSVTHQLIDSPTVISSAEVTKSPLVLTIEFMPPPAKINATQELKSILKILQKHYIMNINRRGKNLTLTFNEIESKMIKVLTELIEDNKHVKKVSINQVL